MSKKYYVVSEEELDKVESTAFAAGVLFCGDAGPDYDYDRFRSEDDTNISMVAATARPVVEDIAGNWVEVKNDR